MQELAERNQTSKIRERCFENNKTVKNLLKYLKETKSKRTMV